MTVFCTPCSAKKDPSPGDLPAIQRYRSHRIKSVYIAAVSLGLKFLILSGEYVSFASFVLVSSLRPEFASGPVSIAILLPAFVAIVFLIREHQKSKGSE